MRFLMSTAWTWIPKGVVILAALLALGCGPKVVVTPTPLPPPQSTCPQVLGENVVTLQDLTGDIPRNYVGLPELADQVDGLLKGLPPTTKVVRTLVWSTARWVSDDEVTTSGWFHAPLSAQELLGLSNYVKSSPIPVELSVGPLWVMLHNWPEVPVEFWLTADEIADRLVGVVKQFPKEVWAIDAYNEYMVESNQEEVMKRYWPRVLAHAREAGIPVTVSVIFDVDSPVPLRAISVYDWLQENGGFPDFAEIHINGWSNEAIVKHLPTAVADFRNRYGLEVGVGECDVVLSKAAKAVIESLCLKFFMRWNPVI